MPKMVSTRDNQWNRNHFLGESENERKKLKFQKMEPNLFLLTFFDDQISHDKCHRMSGIDIIATVDMFAINGKSHAR